MRANNSQKLREALERIRDSVYVDPDDNKCHSDIDASDLREICDVALAAPPRNCDVGTAEEQGARAMEAYSEWRNRFSGMKLISAIMAWAQMPYEEGGAE